jgi:16S rRNA (guanine(966)-N(2))-methyltransferase RsmD
MRIIGGVLKGRTLYYPPYDIRPTTDKVRGAVFNMITANFPDLLNYATVCDIFAGAGAVGIEALSRGAQKVIFIENNKSTLRYLYKNLSGFETRAKILKIDARRALSYLKGEQFEIIYLDPPYNKGLIQPILDKIVGYRLLKPKGIVVVESHTAEQYSIPPPLEVYTRKQYKNTLITILIAKESL